MKRVCALWQWYFLGVRGFPCGCVVLQNFFSNDASDVLLKMDEWRARSSYCLKDNLGVIVKQENEINERNWF